MSKTKSKKSLHPKIADIRVVLYPHEALSERAEEVVDFDDDLRARVNRLKEVLKSFPNGLGLAATQTAWMQRVFVCYDNPEGENAPGEIAAFINPVFEPEDGTEPIKAEEACLSLPGIGVPVSRPLRGKLTWQDESGEQHERQVEGLLARCAQHEIDHIDGITILDRTDEASLKAVKPRLRGRKR